MFAIVFSIVLFLGSAVAVVDLIRNKESRTSGRISKLCMIVFGCASFLLLTPAAYNGIDSFFGYDNTARWIANSCGLAGAVGAQVMMIHWVHTGQRARRATQLRLAIWAIVVTGMAVALFSTPTAENPYKWQAENTTKLGISIYLALYFGHMTWTCVEILRYAPRYAMTPAIRYNRAVVHIRIGLWFTVVTGIGGLVYGLSGLVIAVADDLGAADLPGQLNPVYLGGLAVAAGSLLFAVALPILVGGAMRSYRAYQCCLMHPFWAALTDDHQEHLLETAARRWAYNFGCIFARQHQKLARRITEIRDVYLRLTPYMDSRVQDLAAAYAQRHGVSGKRFDAVVEAAVVRVALYLKTRGFAAPKTTDPAGKIKTGAFPDWPQEAKWLLKVSNGFSGPVAAAVLAEVHRSTDDTGWTPSPEAEEAIAEGRRIRIARDHSLAPEPV
ncbi:MAG: hypothetical protein HOV87_11960 [Catenulispora sp.]|nr:hypothetical protein [Catenulispora sp.]NUT40035.1 hypothetical protein [Thermoactinospora sp.]